MMDLPSPDSAIGSPDHSPSGDREEMLPASNTKLQEKKQETESHALEPPAQEQLVQEQETKEQQAQEKQSQEQQSKEQQVKEHEQEQQAQEQLVQGQHAQEQQAQEQPAKIQPNEEQQEEQFQQRQTQQQQNGTLTNPENVLPAVSAHETHSDTQGQEEDDGNDEVGNDSEEDDDESISESEMIVTGSMQFALTPVAVTKVDSYNTRNTNLLGDNGRVHCSVSPLTIAAVVPNQGNGVHERNGNIANNHDDAVSDNVVENSGVFVSSDDEVFSESIDIVLKGGSDSDVVDVTDDDAASEISSVVDKDSSDEFTAGNNTLVAVEAEKSDSNSAATTSTLAPASSVGASSVKAGLADVNEASSRAMLEEPDIDLGKEISVSSYSSAGCESDVEDSDSPASRIPVRIKRRARKRRRGAMALPSTVVRLEGSRGCPVYIVGTAHFSKESQRDVVKTIERIRPEVLVLELCRSRTAILSLDEETILKESTSMDFAKMRTVLQQHGRVQGALYLLLLSVSAHITKQLGMAPGGEFRVAVSALKRVVPSACIQLGDRPINVTLARALSALSLWSKIVLAFHILTTSDPISIEDVEKCKEKDMTEQLLAEMTGQFPAISQVFVKERDMFLARSLYIACETPSSAGYRTPSNVVGVVGIGHLKGIQEYWGKVSKEDIRNIMIIPEPSRSSRIIWYTCKMAALGLVGYGCYKLLVPTTVKTTLSSSLNSSLSAVTAAVVALASTTSSTKGGRGGSML